MASAALDPPRGRRGRASCRPVGWPCTAWIGVTGRHARPGRVPQRPDDQRFSRNRDQSRTRGGDWAVVGLRGANAVRAIGAAALIVGAPVFAGGAFLLAGIALTFVSATIVVRQPALFTAVLTVAAACWVGG